MQYTDFILGFKQFSRDEEYETFGDDERLAREHSEYFSEDAYSDIYGISL